MTASERLDQPDIKILRERHHDLYGYWSFYHWETYKSVEDYKRWLEVEIAKREKAPGGI